MITYIHKLVHGVLEGPFEEPMLRRPAIRFRPLRAIIAQLPAWEDAYSAAGYGALKGLTPALQD